ncbi:hypothetical protein RHIZ_07120 [Rhizobium skierniewicense]|uniref:hypothetical protein n=1 Tax=Rhizobium skierniewicense TaxID=984260 RepID=UPI001FAB386D|nr:hypothetical protein [Rhizobium skierniewicense]MCI9865712.1 hypothetical protein [Rhizobium skierniewicense]
MCDLGGVLGLAAGVATAAGEANTAKKNAAMIQQEAKLEYANQEHQRLVSVDAANKEGYQASLEKDRAVSSIRASGEGMAGGTAGLRVAEQERQGALSIANAKDRVRGANVDMVREGTATTIRAQNQIKTKASNPLTTMTNIATSGLSNYGAFK